VLAHIGSQIAPDTTLELLVNLHEEFSFLSMSLPWRFIDSHPGPLDWGSYWLQQSILVEKGHPLVIAGQKARPEVLSQQLLRLLCGRNPSTKAVALSAIALLRANVDIGLLGEALTETLKDKERIVKVAALKAAKSLVSGSSVLLDKVEALLLDDDEDIAEEAWIVIEANQDAFGTSTA